MSNFKLTQEHAEILDDMIQVMFDSNTFHGKELQFDADHFQRDRYVRKLLKKISQEELNGMLCIASAYLKDSLFNPFKGSLSSLWLTENAAAFRAFGGFRELYKIEKSKESYEEQLRISTLATNTSVKDTNWWIIRTSIISVGVTAITLLYIIKDYYKKEKEVLTLPQQEKLQNTMQKADSIALYLKRISEATRSVVKDSALSVLTKTK